MKKLFLFLILALCVVSLLLGCNDKNRGNDDTTVTTSQSTSPSTSPSTAPSTTPSTEPGSTPSSAPQECETHSFGGWKTVKSATCTEAGQKKRTCSVCSFVEYMDVAATGHSYSFGYCITCGSEDPLADLRVLIYREPGNSKTVVERAFDSIGIEYTVSYVLSGEVQKAATYDVYIFCGVTPTEWPNDGAVWLLNATTLPSDISQSLAGYVSTTIPNVTVCENQVASEILSGVSLSYNSISGYCTFSSMAEWLYPVIKDDDNTIFYAGTAGKQPVIVTTFNISDISLTESIRFALIKNMIEYSAKAEYEREKCTHDRINIDAVDATCSDYGLSKGIICSKCHKILVPQELVKPTGKHDIVDGTCTVCGHKEEN